MKLPISLTNTALVLSLTACTSLPEKYITEFSEDDLPSLGTRSTATNLSSTVSINNLADRVRKNHPQLRLASYKVQEAHGYIKQSGRLKNPTLGIGVNKSIPGSEGELELSFSQTFPVTNRLRLEKNITRQALLVAQEEIKAQEQRLINQAQLVAIEILSLEQKKHHIRKQISALNKIANFIEEAAKKGELSSLDASQTRLEAQSLSIKLKSIASQQKLFSNKLKKYIGLPVGKTLRLNGSLPTPQLPSSKLILNNRADYRVSGKTISQSEQELLLQKARRFEDIEMSVTGALGREEDAPTGLSTEGTIGMGFTIPLPWYDKNQGNIEAATARTKYSIASRQALAQSIKLESSSYRQTMQHWLAQNISIESDLLPLAKQTSEELEKAYRLGQSDFTSWLKSKTQELSLQTQLYNNELEFHKARVNYFYAIGQPQASFH